MKNSLKSMMVVAFLGLLSTTACKKQASENSNTSAFSDSKKSSATLLTETCEWTPDTVTVNSTGGYAYAAWTPETVTFPGGPTIQFEGNAGSFIRPVTSGWYIGVIPSESCDDCCGDWDFDLAPNVLVKNDSVGTSPTPQPCNVVGFDQAVPYGLGYYDYSGSTTNIPTIKACIAIWKDASATGVCDVTAPANATEAYILCVETFNVTQSNPPSSDVIYKWYKAK